MLTYIVIEIGNESAGSGGGNQVPSGAQVPPTFSAETVKTSGAGNFPFTSESKTMTATETIMDSLKTMGIFAVFAMFYIPALTVYIAGGFKEFMADFGYGESAVPEAPNYLKYGEASDY